MRGRKVATRITCDRCGSDIIGDPVRMTLEFAKRNTGEEKKTGRPVWMSWMSGREFCEECARVCVDLFLKQKEGPLYGEERADGR